MNMCQKGQGNDDGGIGRDVYNEKAEFRALSPPRPFPIPEGQTDSATR